MNRNHIGDTPMDLSAFRKLCSREFELFDQAWKQALSSKIPLIDKMINYITDQRGKGLRPLLSFLCAKVYGETNQATIQAALVMELLHTATLVHDDVVDNSDTRRGLASLKAVWGNKISVLFGDFLLARALSATIELKRQEALEVLSEIAKRMAKGELQEAAISLDLDTDEEKYFEMISDKTAALFSGAVRLGVLSTDKGDASLDAWKAFGEHLGIAFQIRDDILDYTASSSHLGKPVGGDLKDHKITLPLLLAFKKASETEKNSVLSKIRNGVKKHDIKQIVEFVHQYQGVELAQEKANEYAQRARNLLQSFPPNEASQHLLMFVEFAVNRGY
ncbi:MAG: polyprenyl synthetase family protein [bacterium]|nr:polyprenyl synthetase family protein [bacterium]